jgi:hypothetical protein
LFDIFDRKKLMRIAKLREEISQQLLIKHEVGFKLALLGNPL